MPDEIVHACPEEDSAVTPCCGLTPFELPPGERMTVFGPLVTCGRIPREAFPLPDDLSPEEAEMISNFFDASISAGHTPTPTCDTCVQAVQEIIAHSREGRK